MYHKDGKILEQQKARRLLLLKYSRDADSISHLCKIVKLQRGVVYRLFDDDPELKKIVLLRIAGEETEKTTEELLADDNLTDKDISEVPTLREIVKSVLEPHWGKSEAVYGQDYSIARKLEPKKIVIEVDHPANALVHTNSQNADDRVRKAEQICNLVAAGSTTNQACEILGVKTITFLAWINPVSQNYLKEIADMYSIARTTFNNLIDEETHMLAKQSLRTLVEGRQIKLQTKIGRVQKDGTIKTTQIRETEKSIEPNFAAVAKVLTTREAAKYGTPEERRTMQGQEAGGENYELRTKSLEDLEAEEAALLKMLYPDQK